MRGPHLMRGLVVSAAVAVIAALVAACGSPAGSTPSVTSARPTGVPGASGPLGQLGSQWESACAGQADSDGSCPAQASEVSAWCGQLSPDADFLTFGSLAFKSGRTEITCQGTNSTGVGGTF